jgi:RNA polymerase sigma-70 factor (ECF subfamily)
MQEFPLLIVPRPEAIMQTIVPIEGDDSGEAGGRPENAQRTDEQLMAAFARGQAVAFDVLFQRYKQPLFGFFRRRLANPAHAEELMQETFLAIVRSAPRYEALAMFRSYLYAVGFKILRAHRRKSAFRAAFWRPAEAGREPATEPMLDAELVMRQALGKLDRMESEILMLREYEQLSYAEIADVMGLPVNTVRTRLYRARVALREVLTSRAPQHSAAKFAVPEERA